MTLLRPRWLLALACVLPLVVEPPTHAQPPDRFESSRGTYPLPAMVGMRGETFVIVPQRQHVIDYRGIEHFDLLTAPGVRLTLAGDSDLALIRALNGLNGQRVRLTLEPLTPERLER